MIISIDGPAGSGKSTVAKIISKHLDFIHLNSGSLYRGVVAYLLSINFDIKSLTLNSEVPEFKLETKFVDGVQHVYVNNTDFTSQLRDNEVSSLCPYVANNKIIRKRIDNCQRAFAKDHNIVMEGRDIGSYVFPNADFKFYLDCDVKERAKRRYLEEQAKGNNISLKDILNQTITRDNLDKAKEIAPLVIPENAIIVDSTGLSIDQVCNEILSYTNLNSNNSKNIN